MGSLFHQDQLFAHILGRNRDITIVLAFHGRRHRAQDSGDDLVLRDHMRQHRISQQGVARANRVLDIFREAIDGEERAHVFDIGPLTVLFVVAAGAAIQAIPATVAGAGMGEVAAASLYVAMGLSWREAVLLAAIDYGYRLLTAIMGGLWELFRIGAPTGATGQPRTAAAKRNAQ